MAYPLIGNHPSIIKIRELVSMVSEMALNVLLLGETGTGKDVVARLLHSVSVRNKRRFIKINCAALPFTLLESELFGYEKGAFTGADSLKLGKFEIASGGVLFLDEIGDMPMNLQAKLLNVLQNGEFNRLGGIKNIKVDTWVISSTNHNLEIDMKQGLFREDLFYRLNVIQIEMPPLRERKTDIPLLTEYFIRKNESDLNIEIGFTLDPDLYNLFQKYYWPGNVRELSSVILRLMVEDEPEKVKADFIKNIEADSKLGINGSSPEVDALLNNKGKDENKTNLDIPLKHVKTEAVEYIEKRVITNVLKMTNGNKSKAAKMLKISYKTLFTKMHALGIQG